MKHFLFFISVVFVFAGCAGKEFFEPEDTVGEYKNTTDSLKGNIVSMNKDEKKLTALYKFSDFHEDFKKMVNYLRSKDPLFAISTDIIV